MDRDAARFRARHAVRYSFIVMDLHHLLLAGLPAHSAYPLILLQKSPYRIREIKYATIESYRMDF
jgi:hypothetical protein